MEVMCSSSVGMESLLSSAMVALLAEISTSVVKSSSLLLVTLCNYIWRGSRTNGITIEFPREPRQMERLSKADLSMEKQPDPETKDASETEDDGEDNDGGEDEEDFSGEEEDDEDDKDSEDEPEANGDGGSGDDDNDDEDGDGEEEDDEEGED
ncbi:uncharacterized protein [Coffea arabica]|uniref:Uncharacterized protein isoform X1 n=2 Tax=Coffea arabica TaxID=13443 RepID=A0A6P6SKK2_COFAR|nr:acidic leucine-rich nuclear phosphoprotein 32 family member B-like isoform X1 [Coffea arabica]